MLDFVLSLLVIYVLTITCVESVEPWTGSKLGTDHYNKELEAIEFAKLDYAQAMESMQNISRKELLCTTFLKAEMVLSPTIIQNVEAMGNLCDWAIVIYGGNEVEVNATCSTPSLKGKAVHCARSTDSFHEAQTSIPKTVLYQSLLPVLPKYHRVFLMDEDISLEGFNASVFLNTWQCAFQPRPLIVQPLIRESNQYLIYVNEKPWMEGKWADVKATTVGYIEQQVPLFDSIFFTWFVRRVLSQTKEYSIQYGIDWGHDRSWCNAAKMYVRDVLHWDKTMLEAGTLAPCALITSRDTGVHHLNKMTMRIIRGNAAVFRKHAFLIVQKYVDLFPTWVGMDMLEPNNPLDPKNEKKFFQIRSVNNTCLTAINPSLSTIRRRS